MKQTAVLLITLLFTATTYGSLFDDVPKTHWAYEAIADTVDAGILQGYDNKFHGNRQLNRYQMAVITAKILKKFSANPGLFKGDEEVAKVEALTIEFADELSLLKIKVGNIEDELEAIRNGEYNEAKATKREIGFTAFANVALVYNQDEAGGNRYSSRNTGLDSMFFDVPQVSLGVDKEVSDSVYFHAQMDFNSEVNVLGNGVAVNEAYFIVDELAGNVGGKLGAFASPFSMEHNGPFRTLNMTITPSIINTYHESFRFTGLELKCNKDKKPCDIDWKLGIVSASDNVRAIGVAGDTNNNFVLDALEQWAPLMTDLPANVNNRESDDGFGYYLWVGKKPEHTEDWGWNFSYLDNGGDTGATAPATASSETHFYQLGLEWLREDYLVVLQYLSGTEDNGVFDIDFDSFFFLFNYKVNDKSTLTLRYDHIKWDTFNDFTAKGITLAYNRQLSDNTMLQFEYLSPDSDDLAPDDIDDDLLQIRYRVHF